MALLLAQLGCGVLGPPQSQTPSGGTPVDAGGRLLFLRNSGLWAMNLKDGSVSELVKPPDFGQVLGARWSPDGKRVAYAVFDLIERRTPVASIYVANSDGSGAQKILGSDQGGTFYQAPVWSADGSNLYVQHTSDAQGTRIRRIERIPAAGGTANPLVEEVGNYDISPDGRWLAIVRLGTGGFPAIALADLQTGDGKTLVESGAYEVISAPRFDPTSKKLLFSAAQAGTPVQMVPFGSGPGSAPPTPALPDSNSVPPAAPAASPTTPLSVGLSLLSAFEKALPVPAVVRAHGPPLDMYTVPITGGEVSRLASLAADEPMGAWSPDGSQIAVVSTEYVGLLPATGGTPRQLLTPGGYGSVDWSR